MITILFGSLVGESKQVSAVSSSLTKCGYKNVLIDFHKINKDSLIVRESRKGLEVVFCDEVISPNVVYVVNNIRIDSIINIPQSVVHPNSYRFSVEQLFMDVRFSFQEAVWFPGNYDDIERGDSKPFVLSMARKCGLCVPKLTINSRNIPPGSLLCKKPLGFPFRITMNKNTGKEVGLTGVVDFDDTRFICDDYFWQWQSLIEVKKQVRCYVFEKKIWSVLWKRNNDHHCDLRFKNQETCENIDWEEHELPIQISDRLLSLMEILGLKIAAPEFLIDEKGEYVFIDLNPCGDWYGFFPDKTNLEIIQTITNGLVGAL